MVAIFSFMSRTGNITILNFTNLNAKYMNNFLILKDACYGLGKNSQNQQLLDILACNSARPSFNMRDFEKMVYYLKPECPEVADFCKYP